MNEKHALTEVERQELLKVIFECAQQTETLTLSTEARILWATLWADAEANHGIIDLRLVHVPDVITTAGKANRALGELMGIGWLVRDDENRFHIRNRVQEAA